MISSEELAEAKRVAEWHEDAAKRERLYDPRWQSSGAIARHTNAATVIRRLLEENERMREALEREKHGTEAGRLFVEFVLRHTMPERARAISHAELYSIISNHPTARSALRGELSG